MEKWLEVLGIIELIVGLLVLVFLGYVLSVIVKYRHIEFNRYWRSRSLICGSAFIWVVFLLFGNEYLWNSVDGIFGVKPSSSNAICALHVFFTVGSSEPLFFLIFLFIIQSKTSDKNQTLYIQDPNYYVYIRSLLWAIPIVIIHIVILILDASSISEPRKLFWTVYDKEGSKCAVPIISTAAFAIFFVIFLFFFTYFSRTLIRSVINRTLINRLRLTQIAFISFLPLEVAIRVVLIFTLNIGSTSIALFHAFFFVDIIIVIIGVLEFAFFPVSDELGFYFIKVNRYKSIKGEKDGEDIDIGITISTNSPDNFVGKSNNIVNSNNINSNNSLIPISEYEKTVKDSNKSSKLLTNPFKDQEDIEIDEFGDDSYGTVKKNNKSEIGNIEMEKIKLTKHKSPVLDRVRDTEPVQVPPLPLSTPLSSSPTTTNTLSPPSSLSSSPPSSGHDRKKSHRFSFSSKRKSSTSNKENNNNNNNSPSSTSPTSTPSSTSPPNQSRPLFQQNPVENFKDQLYKYSQNKRF